MRSTLCCLLICLTFFCVVSGTAYNPWENPNRFKVVFYNVENFFDTVDDPTTNDGEYTPKGKNHWTVNHMKEKAGRIYKALISAAGGTFPDIIGFAEIENLDVLEFLLKNTPLGEIGYGIVHKESPDPRGIDVALLYKKNRVMPVSFHFIAVGPTAAKPFNSRDILQFDCRIAGERVCFFVNHWPSRAGGYMQTTGKRNYAAGLLRHRLDSLFNHDKSCRILLMGDFNATPDEDCLASILQASMDRKGKLVNLACCWNNRNPGTIRTKGKWEIFDQFIVSQSLLSGGSLKMDLSQTMICTEAFLLEPDKRYLGKKPFRTYLGPIYHGGTSDHLPIVATLVAKE